MKIAAASVMAALMGLGVGLSAQADEEMIAKGKEIYTGKGACVSCHGATGSGDGVAAAALNPKPRSFADGVFMYDTDDDGETGTDADLANIINNGAAKYGGSMFMTPRADIVGEELDALIAYVRSLKAE